MRGSVPVAIDLLHIPAHQMRQRSGIFDRFQICRHHGSKHCLHINDKMEYRSIDVSDSALNTRHGISPQAAHKISDRRDCHRIRHCHRPYCNRFRPCRRSANFVNEYFFHTAQTFSSSLTEAISNYLRELRDALTGRADRIRHDVRTTVFFPQLRMPQIPACHVRSGHVLRPYISMRIRILPFRLCSVDGVSVRTDCKAIFSIGICHNKTVTAAIALCTSAVLSAYVIRNHRNWIWNDETKPFIEMESKLSGLEKPTILNWEYFEYAVGTSAEALPACRYWAEQTNAQSFSRGPQLASVKARIPDIITVQSHDAGIIHPDKQSTLDSLNYQYIGSVVDLFGLSCNIYIKEELTPLLNQMPH